mgnify:CR=1 FL=1
MSTKLEINCLTKETHELREICQDHKEMFGYKGGELPVSEQVLKRVIALPMHVQMTDTDINRVLEGLAAGIEAQLFT